MDISFIIVEYMDTKTLEEAVFSIQNHVSDVTKEIIVISNSSYSSNEQAEIQSKFFGTRFIFNQSNLGFAKAVNQGVKVSTGEFILLLNPDAKILNNDFFWLIEFMEQHPNIGMLGPQIIDRDGEIQDSYRYFMTIKKLLCRNIRRFRKISSGGILENKNYSDLQPIDWVSGACMLVRREAIESVGLMDERYFMYIEDMDWCRRFWKVGWEVWYQPDWKIEHNSGRGSTKSFNIGNKLMWIHLISFCKYYFKWLRSES